jgi:2-oxoisovalerate ferredoxin oxidoreductase beta subunit
VFFLSPCPTIWGKDPVAARTWVLEKMVPEFPLSVFRDPKDKVLWAVDNAPPPRPVADVLCLRKETGGRAREVSHAHPFKDVSINIAGFGGQGVLMLGQLLAEMGIEQGLEVSWLPSYGPEMRSGSAHCYVSLSKNRIGSPLTAKPDVLIAMNELSLRKFAPHVPVGGLILYNGYSLPSDLPTPEAQVYCVPAAEIADKLGSAKAANIVMMGALLEETGCFEPATAARFLEAKVKNPTLLQVDLKAIAAGCSAVDHQVNLGPVSQPDGFA